MMRWLVFLSTIFATGCALFGYNFDGYRPEASGSGGASGSSSTGPGGSGTAGGGGSAGNCTNGMQDGTETGIDCGGPCPPCPCQGSIFQPRLDVPIGSSQLNVRAGDVTGDGNHDIVLARQDNGLGVVVGNGDGSFGGSALYSLTSYPQGLTLADFNGDNKLDAAVTIPGATTLGIFLGSATGMFGPVSTLALGPMSAPLGVAAADLNADTILDLLVSDYALHQVYLLLGDGAGAFTASPLPAEMGPAGIAVGDFDQDNDTDFVVANQTGNSLAVYPQTAPSTFGTPISYSAGLTPTYVTVADFNGDTFLDIASASYGSPAGTLLLGKGDGTFSTAAGGLQFGIATVGIVADDFNFDNKLDVAGSGAPAQGLVVLLGNGDGTFAPAFVLTSLMASHFVDKGDFNGDDKVDLVVSSTVEQNVGVFLNGCP